MQLKGTSMPFNIIPVDVIFSGLIQKLRDFLKELKPIVKGRLLYEETKKVLPLLFNLTTLYAYRLTSSFFCKKATKLG